MRLLEIKKAELKNKRDFINKKTLILIYDLLLKKFYLKEKFILKYIKDYKKISALIITIIPETAKS